MRIDKFICKALEIPRRDARDIIKSKRVKIGDRIALKNDWDTNGQEVYLDDKKLDFKEVYYLMLNKPAGYLSATFDKDKKCVLDLIEGYNKKDLSLVGRLDIDTIGLLILTNDGKLLHRLTSPKTSCFKKYYVEADNNFETSDIEVFKNGMDLYDGKGQPYRTKEAKLELLGDNKAYVYISEGKYHQVKKMCKFVGKNVILLKRIAIGNLVLDESLKEGEYRELTEKEIDLLKKSI